MLTSTLRYYAIQSYQAMIRRNIRVSKYREGAVECHVFLEENMVTVFYKSGDKVLAKDFTIRSSWL